MKILRKSYLPLAVVIGLFLLMYLIESKVSETSIKEMIIQAGPFGIVVLIFLFWLTNILAPLSGSPFLYAGFYLYGQMVVIYAFIAAITASITNFWIAKILGRNIVKKLAGEDGLEKIDNLIDNYGLQSLFVFRLFLKEFHDVVSYAFGLTRLKFIPYFVVSTLGMIPATIIWYFISLKIHDAIIFTVISWLVAYFSLTIYIVWIKLRRKRKRTKQF